MSTESGTIKKDYFWNTVGSGVYALASMVLAFAAMHIAGPDDGGIFGFGYSAFGQQMFIIAYFGIRPFHITDASWEYSYEEYRRLRILTCLGAAAAAAGWLLIMRFAGIYTDRKAAVIFLLALCKIADGAGDLYESECQRAGFLWIGGRELAFRTILAACVLTGVLALTRDILKAAAAAVLAHTLYLLWFRHEMEHSVFKVSRTHPGQGRGIGALAGSTVLLFLSVFVDFYIFSASKYAIDLRLTDADSGIFNILFMPTSVIYLAANFIIKPYMTRLSALYEAGSGAESEFDRVFRRLKTAVLLLSAAALTGTVLLGRPALYVLELLLGNVYTGELTGRFTLFLLIILGGCFYALTNLYYYILIIMRRQKQIFRNYLVMAAVAFALADPAVRHFGLAGAAGVYPLYMGMITFVFAWTCSRALKADRQRPDTNTDNGTGIL